MEVRKMSANEKILMMCKNYLSNHTTYTLNIHMAKNIVLKINEGRKLTSRDLDFITSLQFNLVG